MATQAQMTIDEAYQKALEIYEKGQLGQAEKILLSIVKTAPKYPNAHHLISIINMQLGRHYIAAAAMEHALAGQQTNAGFLTNAIEIFRKAEQLEKAVAAGIAAIRLEPGNVAAHANLGIAYYDQKNFVDAQASQRRALALDTEFVPALNNMGSIAREEDDLDRAIEFYERAHRVQPANPEPANNLVSCYLEAERLEDARRVLTKIASVAGRSPELHRNLGRVALIDAEFDIAENHFRTAITVEPSKAESYLGLAQTLMEKNHPKLAEIEIETALRLKPDSAHAHMLLGTIKAHLGDLLSGIESLKRALDIDPQISGAELAIGNLQIELGEFEAARQSFEQVRKTSKDPLGALLSLARLDKVKAGDPLLVELEAQRGRAEKAPPAAAAGYHFAMGKVYEDLKDYDKAFADFAAGAKKKRSTLSYDADRNDQLTDHIIETFTTDYIAKLQEASIPSKQSIFVVGMPRSGTTLTEAILSAHSKIYGAGERNDMQNLFGPNVSQPEMDFVDHVNSLSTGDLKRKAEDYENVIRPLLGSADHAVDKMPANFQLVGLIYGLFPNAKIVHTARSPLDTCLSNFTHIFERSQLHSYDLEELGRFFNNYVRLMKHWTNVLPNGTIYTSHYEDLVEEPEKYAKRLISFVNLKWEDTCMSFHENKRRIRTASVTQVRKPIYKSSTEKWRPYEKHLELLINVIGESQIIRDDK